MKTTPSALHALAVSLLLLTPTFAGPPVKRCIVRDGRGQARVAYVRVADNRVLYPRVIQQVATASGGFSYRAALASNFRPAGYGVYRRGFGNFYPANGSISRAYGNPARYSSTANNGYGGSYNYGTNYGYRPNTGYFPPARSGSTGNYGVDKILNRQR